MLAFGNKTSVCISLKFYFTNTKGRHTKFVDCLASRLLGKYFKRRIHGFYRLNVREEFQNLRVLPEIMAQILPINRTNKKLKCLISFCRIYICKHTTC